MCVCVYTIVLLYLSTYNARSQHFAIITTDDVLFASPCSGFPIAAITAEVPLKSLI